METQSIPQMFFARAAGRGQQPAQLVKRGGTWQAISWQALSDNVRSIAQGLLTFKRWSTAIVARISPRS